MRRFAIVTTILCVGALAFLLSSQHRLRMVVMPFREAQAQSLNWDTSLLHREPSRFPLLLDSSRQFMSCVTLLSALSAAHPTPVNAAMPIVDDPDSCFEALMNGASLHCYNIDLAISDYLVKKGVYSRLWDMNGTKGLGGNGHNVLEVLDTRTMHWYVLDPYYHCYFARRGDSTALSFVDLRKLLVSSPNAILVHWYAPPPFSRTEEAIMKEFAFLAPFSAVHANNDFRWRYDHRYGWLMPFASLFDAMPLRMSRAIRTVMLGDRDTRFILEDESTPQYPFALSHALFYTLAAAALLSVLLLLVTIWKSLRLRSDLKRTSNFHLAAGR